MIASKLYHLCKSFGRPAAARLSRWREMAGQIGAQSKALQAASDGDLVTRSLELRWRAKSGMALELLTIDAFALVHEASRRTVGMQHYPVQTMGAISLLEGHVAEMQTGEGKTLTAVMPAFLRALPGQGCHIITVNDYLAKRDAETMGPIYEKLGLSVGCIQSSMETDERRAMYAKDITYTTSKELGFDFLRDRLRVGAEGDLQSWGRSIGDNSRQGEQPVQREHYFALIDEADSVLIDEARTPLIIGLTQPNDAATVNLLRWCRRVTQRLEVDTDFIFEAKRRTAYLTDAGCRRVLLMAKPSILDGVDAERIYTHVEGALTARYAFQRDRDYVVVNDEIVIVDEGTGRLMDGRKWQDGLHQAVEAKESVPITAATGQAARITVQSFFRQYRYLAGMSGTVVAVRRELKKTYDLRITVVPTNRPCIRNGAVPRFFANIQAKQEAIIEKIVAANNEQKAVLVGTPSVEASEALGALLKERGIDHQILNAHFQEKEAAIIGKAGEAGKVTIATNMAGRGTDIKLDEQACQCGGLHVIATEMHSSGRIDRQLIGRSARQGDPGSYQFFLSHDDELFRCLPLEKREAMKRNLKPDEKGELPAIWLGYFRSTQKFLEKSHRKERKQLYKQEKYRAETYKRMGLDPYLELTE